MDPEPLIETRVRRRPLKLVASILALVVVVGMVVAGIAVGLALGLKSPGNNPTDAPSGSGEWPWYNQSLSPVTPPIACIPRSRQSRSQKHGHVCQPMRRLLSVQLWRLAG